MDTSFRTFKNQQHPFIMNLPFETRSFYPDELSLLTKLKYKKEKEINANIKFHQFLIAGVLGAGCTYIASILPDSFWTFLFGTIAVFSFSFIVFMPYEQYKMRRNQKRFLQQLSKAIEKGTVETCSINAKRMAIAKEYEDEGDLYIIEYEIDRILYLWDFDYNLRKKMPCLKFEIYEDNFNKIVGRQVYALSERIKPIIIDKKAKWNYMGKVGTPGQLETAEKNFNDLINEFNNCV